MAKIHVQYCVACLEKNLDYQKQETEVCYCIDGAIDQQEPDNIDAPTPIFWMQGAAKGEPIILDRYALEDENHYGGDFESDDEDPTDTEDSPEGTMFEDPVLEQNTC